LTALVVAQRKATGIVLLLEPDLVQAKNYVRISHAAAVWAVGLDQRLHVLQSQNADPLGAIVPGCYGIKNKLPELCPENPDKTAFNEFKQELAAAYGCVKAWRLDCANTQKEQALFDIEFRLRSIHNILYREELRDPALDERERTY
jgi:hypothetical protein